MSIYHCSIKIINRAGGRSAVASAAYRSGEKLYNEETGLTHDFTRKGGVIMSEIVLPEGAPEKYKDREILWNEVQKIEKRSDAQFAREVEVALPVEMTRDEQIECVMAYIMENFVSKGMIADWALHDKDDGNPHAHIMLTVRGVDSEGWQQKQKTVFANARDEKGRPIYNPDLPVYDPKNRDTTSQYRIPQLDENGKQKERKREGKGTELLWEKISIPANDWNDKANAEIWRESWAKHCNKYLDKKHQIDHRSYVRQGIELEPTIHEGVVARQIQAKGKVADRCEINKHIKERNKLSKEIAKVAKQIKTAITEKVRDIFERFTRLKSNSEHYASTGKDARANGKAGGGNTVSGKSEQAIARRKRDIKRRERELNATDKIHEIIKLIDSNPMYREFTERVEKVKRALLNNEDITETDSQIIATALSEDLRDFIKKMEERNERIDRLYKQRRTNADSDISSRSTSGPGVKYGGELLSAAGKDASRIIREAEASISNSKARVTSAELDRKVREDERSRQDTGREQEAYSKESTVKGIRR